MRRTKWFLFVSVIVAAIALACSSAPTAAPEQPQQPAPAAPAQQAPAAAPAQPQSPAAPAQPAPAAPAAQPPAGTGAQAPPVVRPAQPVREVPQPMGGPQFGGTLKYVPQGSIKFIDPMATGAIVTGTVGRHAYDQVFWRDGNYNIFPQMAESWSVSDDGKQYTFKIREGITFHNGDPLRVQDIAESHDRFARVDPLGRQLLGISPGNQGVETQDQKFSQIVDEANSTIIMNFDQPTAMVLEFLAQLDPRQPSIMHESIWNLRPGEPVDEAIGTGAYMLSEWIPGEVLKFEKFEGYVSNSGEPWDFTKGEIVQYLDGFEALDIPDHQTRVAALTAGQVDVLDDFRIDLAASLDGRSDVIWSPIRDGNMGTMDFNHHHPPFDGSEAGILARRAVMTAANNEEIMIAAVGEERLWSECYTVIHCGTPWKSAVTQEVQAADLKTREGNLELARQLLNEAEALSPGLKSQQIRLIGASDMPFMPEAALVMWQTMEDIGFENVELVAMDWASRVAITGQGDGPWEAATSWSNFANGLNPLAPQMPASPAANGWVNEEIGPLRDQFLTETDPVKLQEIFDDMNRVIYENPASMNFFMFSPPRAIRADVQGFCMDCLFPILHNVWLDR